MRRALTAASFCVAAFALLGGCQPEPRSEPCACPKGTGCQCPLPGSQHASGGANKGGTETAKREQHVAQRDHHRTHRRARTHHHLQNREEEAEQREASEEGRGESRGRESSRRYSNLPYGYRSQSHRYSLRESQRNSEGYGSEEAYAHEMHRHSRRMHRHAEGPGPEYDENGPGTGEEAYGPEGDQEYGPRDQGEPEYGAGSEEERFPQSATDVGQMSINSPSALDSWHGYGVDCPELYDRE